MTTINDVTGKILLQCQNMFQELSKNEDNFPNSTPLTTQTPLLPGTPQSPSLIILNNSFLFREKPKIKTTKSPYCLALTSTTPKNRTDIVVAEYSFTRDWDLIPPQATNYPVFNDLSKSVQLQLRELGEIIYILIGNIGIPGIITESINSSLFSEMVFDCSIKDLDIQAKQIYANPNNTDIELWDMFCKKTTITDSEVDKLKPRFFDSLGKLRKNLLSPLTIPNNRSGLEDTFFDSIIDAFDKEISAYEESLVDWKAKNNIEKNFNNILRISYNFVDDIEKLLRLIVSISDLKPLLFWMTIYSQYKLKKQFSKLEWEKNNKPSIAEYSRLIKGARNSRFHNMMNMSNTLEVDMNNISIQAKRLVFFNEYTNKDKNNFEFQDQQLIDVLIEFNRVAEKTVSDDFWTQNLEIMKAAKNLVLDFTESLKLLRLLE